MKRIAMKRNRRVILTIMLMVLSGCGDNNSDDSVITDRSASADATYQVNFFTFWDENNFPAHFPVNRHFSGLIGATHNENVSFWSDEGVSSRGIEVMAEQGKKEELESEIKLAKNSKTAEFLLSGSGIPLEVNQVNFEFDVNIEYPLVTLVSMVAPSPDWFVGVDSLPLYNDENEWVDELVVNLKVYDAGTDNGNSFGAGNENTEPKESIRVLTSVNTDFLNGVHKDNADLFIGTMTFKRVVE
jgi:hypothetical protein